MWVLRIQKNSGANMQNYNPFIFNNYTLYGDNGTVSCTSAQLIAGNSIFFILFNL